MGNHLFGAPAAARGVIQYGSSPLAFRGPARDTGNRFLAVLGGAAAYGRDVEVPWPDMLEQRLGLPVVNMALPRAGLDAWVGDPEVMEILGAAERVVVHLAGAALVSNRFYSVHPRRNDRFIAASGALRHLYPEVDFTEFAFVRHMILALARHGEARLAPLVAELQAAWTGRMQNILARSRGRAILVWADRHPPPARAALPGGVDFVDQRMVDALGAPCVTVCLPPDECLATSLVAGGRVLPGPAGHAHIAAAVAEAMGARGNARRA